MILGIAFLILVFSSVLIKAADMVVVALRRIARQTHTGIFALSAIIIALGTSLPELFVGITSSLEGSSNLSIGVVLGSNIANIALIGGITAFIVGKVYINPNYIKKDVWTALIAGTLPIILIYDRSLSRIDGMVLIIMYFAYSTSFFKLRFNQIVKLREEEDFIYRFMRKFKHIKSEKTKEYGRLFLGIALLLFSADSVVKLSKALADYASVPLFVIGAIILAVGTSLPEFALSLKSLEDHEPSVYLGNLLGSTVVNSTLIVGISAVISPINVFAINQYLIASIAFVIIFLTFWFFIKSKHRLDRWEAGMLLILYLTFCIVEFV